MTVSDRVGQVLALAQATEGACEEPPGKNGGPYVDRILAGVGLTSGQPWCAAQLYDWGRKALGAVWPLPRTGSCAALGNFAQAHGVLEATPVVGDVFLWWEQVAGVWRFAHTGLVLAVPAPATASVIAGNTVRPSHPGDIRDGWLVATRTDPYKPTDRFIRWSSLLKEA